MPRTAGIEASYSPRPRCIRNTAPPPTRPPSSTLCTSTDAPPRLPDIHPPSPADIPPEKEGVPIVRISGFDLSSFISVMVTPEDIAEEIRTSFPGTEEIVVQYLAGYLLDDAGEDEDILQIARLILESVAGRNTRALEALMTKLADMLGDLLAVRASQTSRGTGLTKLDRAMEIGKTTAMSGTIAMSQGVDLESINKGK